MCREFSLKASEPVTANGKGTQPTAEETVKLCGRDFRPTGENYDRPRRSTSEGVASAPTVQSQNTHAEARVYHTGWRELFGARGTVGYFHH
jgi:hypothetical protein